MLKDRYGNPLSTQSRAAVDKYNDALELIRLYRGDPIAALDAAIEDDPDFAMAWAARAGMLVQQTDKAYVEEAERSLSAGVASGGNERERAHLAAAQAWAQGRMDDSTPQLRPHRAGTSRPTCSRCRRRMSAASFSAGRASCATGRCRRCARSSAATTAITPLLGMAAFGLEECGDYARAEAFGTEAVALDAARCLGGACGRARQRDARRREARHAVAARQRAGLGAGERLCLPQLVASGAAASRPRRRASR